MKTGSTFSAIFLLTLPVVVVVLTASTLVAQNREYGDRKPNAGEVKQSSISASASSRSGLAASSHDGASPFPTPTPTDTNFVVDTGQSGLDTGCVFRSHGSLKFTVAVTRYVGEVDSQGKLINPQGMVNNRVISPTATLIMPAEDVDFDAPTQAPDQPERDRILFNGEPLGDLGAEGYLNGANNRWRINAIKIPISKIKFAQLDPGGGPPNPGLNEIEILIDQANISTGEELWCTSVDWAAITFNALDPVIMIHGNGESGAFWDRLNFTLPFRLAGVPYDRSINLPTTFVEKNAATLSTEIPRVARRFGVKHVHLVTHSKGGLDSRAFLKLLPTEDAQLAVMSLTTLSTPHHGSALADYIRDVQIANVNVSQNPERAKLIARWAGEYDDGRKNLTTRWVRGFNRENLPLPLLFTVDGEDTGVNYFAFSADANADDSVDEEGEPTISSLELVGTGFKAVVGHFFTNGGTVVYRTLYHVASTDWGVDAQGRVIVVEVSNEEANLPLQRNDMLVTIYSARLPGWFLALPEKKKNHATVADEEMGNTVYQLISTIHPLQ